MGQCLSPTATTDKQIKFFVPSKAPPVQPSLRHSSAFTQIRCTHPIVLPRNPGGSPLLQQGERQLQRRGNSRIPINRALAPGSPSPV